MSPVLFIEASMYGIESHHLAPKQHFPVVDQTTHEQYFDHLATSSLISIVMRPELATSGNLKVKCVVTLLTLYHRSNEISVETVGLVQPKLKTSRHLTLPINMEETDIGNNNNGRSRHPYYFSDQQRANADYFADSRMNGAISRYKISDCTLFIIFWFIFIVKNLCHNQYCVV